MKRNFTFLSCYVQDFRARVVLVMFLATVAAMPVRAQSKPWVTAYVGNWWLGANGNGTMPISKINFKGMTVCDYMAVLPSSTSPFISASALSDTSSSGSLSRMLTSAAHAAGVKCTFTLGSWQTATAFEAATSPSNLSTFVNTIVKFTKACNYDGVDIDWEPGPDAKDTTAWKNLIIALRQALPSPTYLITVTAGWGSLYSIYASVQNYVDQINIMTYDLDTDAPGYNSWYAASVYSNGVVIPADHKTPVPSCNYLVGLYENAGVKASKLGIGCEPGGVLWQGITGVGQSYSSSVKVTYDVTYNTIMSKYYQPSLYHWDSGAQADYLSSPSGNWFLSYDDTTGLRAKLEYASAHIGGIIIYEIGMSYNQATGDNPFLDVAQEFLGRGSVSPNPQVDNTPPVVSVSSPSSGDTVSGTINISAKASDNVGVSAVTFKVDGNQVGTAYSSPYTVAWNTSSVSDGPHTISATAFDAAGNSSSASVKVNVQNPVGVAPSPTKDTTAPKITILSPSNGDTVSGTIKISAKASDNVGVSAVTFRVDGKQVGTASGSPYTVTVAWESSSVPDGPHTISATASDAAGNSTSASVEVIARNFAATDPKITFSSPSDGDTVSGIITISVDASASLGLRAVEFAVDGDHIETISGGPYFLRWKSSSVSNGEHTISATAVDSSGNKSTASIEINVVNSQNADAHSSPPSVTISTPSHGASVSGKVPLRANASSKFGIRSVAFEVDGEMIGSVITTPPYLTYWNSTTVSNATHLITATAVDSLGIESIDSVTVRVDNSSTGIQQGQAIPTSFALSQNFPNPFNPTTMIEYAVPERAYVTLTVYNVLGTQVRTLVSESKGPGVYQVQFDAGDLPSGVYLYRFKAGNFIEMKKLILLK